MTKDDLISRQAAIDARKMEAEMKIPVKLDKGAYMPEKAHETDAGYDIRTPHSFLLRRSDMVMVHTGIHVNIPVGFYGELASKSGLCRDSEITTEAGIIDSGYTGESCVILKSGMKQRYFEAGDKITQLIIHELPYRSARVHGKRSVRVHGKVKQKVNIYVRR